MWDLPAPGLEPVSPALAGRFLTTAPPGKSRAGGFLTTAPPGRPQGKDSDDSPPSFTETKTKTTKIVTSEFYPPQLKKGNKEPNPMVQLSIQDVTQESKVRARTRISLCQVSCVCGDRRREDCSWDEAFPLGCL